MEHISQRVLEMYLGKIVEQAAAVEILRAPQHPYPPNAPFGGAGAGPRHQTPAHHFDRRGSVTAASARRLCVLSTPSGGGGSLQNGNAILGRNRARPSHRLPLGDGARASARGRVHPPVGCGIRWGISIRDTRGILHHNCSSLMGDTTTTCIFAGSPRKGALSTCGRNPLLANASRDRAAFSQVEMESGNGILPVCRSCSCRQHP